MTFVKKYTDDDFLAVLSVNTPQTTTYVAKQTGAGRNTVIRFLTDLEKTGKVARVEIEGGFYAWIKVEPVKENDIEHFRSYVKKYLEQHSESEIAKKVLQSLEE